jgi:hypothetical protein
MNQKWLLILLACALTLGGCSSIDYPKYECGKIWGAERVVKDGDFHRKYLIASKQGYIYALAGALILQKDNKEGREHNFAPLERLHRIDDLYMKDSSTGFEVVTFELFEDNKSKSPSEIVIAFAGSNDTKDWIQNFSPLITKQYQQAVEYVKRVKGISRYESIPLKVTGYSLGGALAVHVTKNPETSKYVNEAWAFNPSPKIYADGNINDKIWLAAQRGEALSILRAAPFRILPGVSFIGATDEHTVDDYYLIKTNRIYGHYRWVLPIQMLHVADFAILKDEGRVSGATEPFEILKQTNFAGAKPCN